MKPCTRLSGKPSSRRMAGGTSTCDTSMEKLARPSRVGLPDRHRVGGRGGFETDGEEDHLAIGILARDRDGVHRGVGDAHVAAFGLDAEKIARGAGDAEHVAVGDQDHAGHGGDGDGLVDDFERRDADRAAGSVNQFELRRQQLVDAVAHERVGLAAADFHQDPGARDGGGDFGNKGAGELGIAILVDEFHGGRLLPGW